jgi:hypothetical protein
VFDEEDSTELKVEFMGEGMKVLRTFSSEEKSPEKGIKLAEGFHTLKWGGDVEGFELPEGVMAPRGSSGYVESFSVVTCQYHS